jgi:2-oxoglutarate dehydrogenase E2 component (dihydrolipoamide succinyltransferase)
MTAIVIPGTDFDDETVLLARWLVPDGTEVTQGQPLLLCEASKVALELASPASGRLRVHARDGSTLRVGSVAGLVLGSGEEEIAGAPNVETAPRATRRAERLAAERGFDLRKLGGNGIITEKAVLAALGEHAVEAPSLARARVRPLSPAQVAIGRRVRQSLDAYAHAFVLGRYEVEGTLSYIQRRLAQGILLPFGDLVVFHLARCLRDFPQFNAHVVDETVHQYEQVNVAFVVEASGVLHTPVVHRADELDVETLVQRMQSLKLEALRGLPRSASLTGGTFTVSVLEGAGLLYQLPIINRAQGAILGVGAVTPELAPSSDGTARMTHTVGLCIAYDHRLVNGGDAARFLAVIGKKLSLMPGEEG